MVNYIALGTALVLSAIAGFFSVIGLATIFSGAFWAVVCMAATLEAAKVVTVSWMTRNWDGCPKAIKYYLMISVGILMIITSMGTFGYLSKAHLVTTNQVEITGLQMQPLETQLQLAERKLQNAQNGLNTLDRLVAETDIKQASKLRNRQRAERTALAAEISDSSREIQSINSQLLPLKTASATTQAELGPLKYVAETVYGSDAEKHFDSAVRFVIFIIVIVFDPLAIVLLIAANHGMKPKSRLTFNKATGKLEVNL